MRDIDEMFKDILNNDNKDMFDNNSWIIPIIILALLSKDKLENAQPIINIYLGDE